MSDQKHGPTILATMFMLTTLGFIAAWIYFSGDNDTVSGELNSARTTRTKTQADIRRLTAETDDLRQLIGKYGDVASIDDEMTEFVGSPEVAEGAVAATNLDAALKQSLDARDAQAAAAVSGQIGVNRTIAELQQSIAAKDDEIQATRHARAETEMNLRQKEAEHSETLNSVTNNFNDLRRNFQDLQAGFETHVDNYRAELEAREGDIRDKRAALVQMRTRSFKHENLSFDIPDGVVANIDQVRELAYINLGSADALSVGTTFSVYETGVGGGRNTEDVKAAIEVITVVGPHLSECRIKNQDRPIANGDPIYNPTFTSGLQPEIALAGRLEGVDRGQLLRLISGSGAKVVVQLTDDGEFVDANNNLLTKQQAEKAISIRTKFLVIAHLADASEMADEQQKATFERIEKNTDWLRDAALEHGVYEIGLSNFLEYIEYSRQTPQQQ